MGGVLHRLCTSVADLLWPRTCAVAACGCAVDRPGRHLCSTCFERLPYREQGGACDVCDTPIPSRPSHAFVCEGCAVKPPPYERLRSALDYRDETDELVKAFKYGGASWLAGDFVDLMEGLVRSRLEAAAIDVVMPVPLHPNRRRQRGYNQAALLAEGLSGRLGRLFDARSLARIRDTPKQSLLGASERRANLDGAFAAVRPERVRGRTILLVDDVTTTGTTLARCAEPLVAAGAARVWCATLARANYD